MKRLKLAHNYLHDLCVSPPLSHDDHDDIDDDGDDGDHAKVQHPDREPKPEGEGKKCEEYSISGGIANVRTKEIFEVSQYFAQVSICLCNSDKCNGPPTTTPKPATKPTPKPGALKCHKCNAVPNPGNPHPDACDATENFGSLAVRWRL